MKKKDVSTINDSVYIDYDEHVDTIRDSRKQVDARNDPIKETHIVKGVSNLSIGVGYLLLERRDRKSVVQVVRPTT